MKKIFQKTAIAAALALPLLASAGTTPIMMDGDGAGGALSAVSVDILDWKPGNALSVGGNPSSGPITAGTTTQLLYQANLGSAYDGTNTINSGQGGAQFFTATAGFLETVLTGGSSPTFGFGDTAVLSGTNFFYIYATNANGNDLAGTGFTGGTLVMSGHIIGVTSSNYNATGFSSVLDNFGTNNYVGTGSITGSGATDINVEIDFANQAYFPGLDAGGTFAFGFFNTSTVTPFNQANPSACFSSDGVTSCNLASNIGTNNGVTDPNATRNFQFQADGNLSFSVVPEPGSLALVGLALGVAGFVGRRSSKKA